MRNNDIVKLDFILNKIIQTDWLVTADDLIIGGFYKPDEIELLKQDFKVFQNIFQELNVGEISLEEDNSWIKPNINSIIFQRNGGFTKKAQDLVDKSDKTKLKEIKNAEREDLELELAKSNIKANKLNEKNSKFNNRVNFINITIGVLNILVGTIVGIITYLSYKAGLLG